MSEIFKRLEGTECYISNLGKVRKMGKDGTYKTIHPYPNNSGYLQFRPCGIYKKQKVFLHKLVALLFIDNPNGYTEINHRNEDHTDNRAENLEWCTREYNANYGTKKQRTKKHRELIIGQYDKAWNLIRTWSRTELNKSEYMLRTIRRRCNEINEGKRNYRGYLWKYIDRYKQLAFEF